MGKQQAYSFGLNPKKALRNTCLEQSTGISLPVLSGIRSIPETEDFSGNIENYIGLTQVPTGIAGPLLVCGDHIREAVYVPLATTEGALVASYSRGAKACTAAGGIRTKVVAEGVQRSPVFCFSTMRDALDFYAWVQAQFSTLQQLVRESSRFAVLESCKPMPEGNQLILVLEYTTGDAAGQNMVTFCTQAICQFLVNHCPVKPLHWYLESNFSGDKKACYRAFTQVRGKKVCAELELPAAVVANVLKSSPASIVRYYRTMLSGVVQSGAMGVNGHFANGLTALLLACGQDVACVSEAAVGFTRFEQTASGDLYVSVTLPNLIVGTVGGGTGLPTQAECLTLLGCSGRGTGRRFAEITAALLLAGELSIAAAIAEGHFARAHRVLGRKK